jgi:hypothetical protein
VAPMLKVWYVRTVPPSIMQAGVRIYEREAEEARRAVEPQRESRPRRWYVALRRPVGTKPAVTSLSLVAAGVLFILAQVGTEATQDAVRLVAQAKPDSVPAVHGPPSAPPAVVAVHTRAPRRLSAPAVAASTTVVEAGPRQVTTDSATARMIAAWDSVASATGFIPSSRVADSTGPQVALVPAPGAVDSGQTTASTIGGGAPTPGTGTTKSGPAPTPGTSLPKPGRGGLLDLIRWLLHLGG